MSGTSLAAGIGSTSVVKSRPPTVTLIRLLEVVFWTAAAALVYVYAGYPLAALAWSKLRPRRVAKQPAEPGVTVAIAAYNEAAHIRATVENKLALDYPAGKLEVIVVSDGSTDGTDDIARSLGARVSCLRQEPRNGKTAALNQVLQRATGDIVVFADANSIYEPGALRHLVANFSDPSVGYVTGKLRYLNPDGSLTGDGCSTYMKYENLIRTFETGFGSVVGVNGGIDAVRRVLYAPMHPDDLPDLVLPLRVVAAGYRVVYDPEALLSERAHANTADEYRMRVRVALRSLWTLKDMAGLLNVTRHGVYALQLISHKLLRYLAFSFMAVTFATSALLWRQGAIYQLAFVAHVAFVAVAGLGLIAERRGHRSRLLFVPYYFALVNLAALQAVIKFVRGERFRVWSPRLG